MFTIGVNLLMAFRFSLDCVVSVPSNLSLNKRGVLLLMVCWLWIQPVTSQLWCRVFMSWTVHRNLPNVSATQQEGRYSTLLVCMLKQAIYDFLLFQIAAVCQKIIVWSYFGKIGGSSAPLILQKSWELPSAHQRRCQTIQQNSKFNFLYFCFFFFLVNIFSSYFKYLL